MNLLEELAKYLAAKLDRQLGVDVFYYEMPDMPDECICVQEAKTALRPPPQVDAASHRVFVDIRAKTSVAANALAEQCYRWMYCSDDDLVNPTGFLLLTDGSYVFSDCHNKPVWNKSDQRGRKTFSFETTVTTQRF